MSEVIGSKINRKQSQAEIARFKAKITTVQTKVEKVTDPRGSEAE